MELEKAIYFVILKDGSILRIDRNDKYFNHYQYLTDFSKQDSYLKKSSFGLTFQRDDNTSRLFFFQELVESGSIVIENQKLLSSEKVSAIDILVPETMTYEELEILIKMASEIDRIQFVFAEVLQDGKFIPLYTNSEQLHLGSWLILEYGKSHLKDKHIDSFYRK